MKKKFLFKICIIIFLFFVISCKIYANSLSEKINIFFKNRDPIHASQMKILIYNHDIFFNKKFDCVDLNIIPINKSKLWGLIEAQIICGKYNQFIQIEIQVKGKYVIASKNIKKDKIITNLDLIEKFGRLDLISLNSYLEKKKLLNFISSRNIKKDEVITASMVHPPWMIKMDQKVSVTFYGVGFKIILEGKAMNNAFEKQELKVKLDSGKIIMCTVTSSGNVIV